MKNTAASRSSKKAAPASKAKSLKAKSARTSSPKTKAAKPAALKVGQKAPAFTLPDEKGRKVSLSDFKGKKVVLFFYPKDDTPGCTKEACSFRDGLDDIRAIRAVVLGVSADSVDSHQRFSSKFKLNFPLLSDVDKRVIQAYDVWKEKSMYGRKYMGIERTTYVIDEQGKIARVFPKVKVDSHLEDVLSEL